MKETPSRVSTEANHIAKEYLLSSPNENGCFALGFLFLFVFCGNEIVFFRSPWNVVLLG
jgi:hypothetical protein